jgi:hypothetical protein
MGPAIDGGGGGRGGGGARGPWVGGPGRVWGGGGGGGREARGLEPRARGSCSEFGRAKGALCLAPPRPHSCPLLTPHVQHVPPPPPPRLAARGIAHVIAKAIDCASGALVDDGSSDEDDDAAAGVVVDEDYGTTSPLSHVEVAGFQALQAMPPVAQVLERALPQCTQCTQCSLTQTHILAHTHVHSRTRTYAHTHAHTHGCTHTRTHGCCTHPRAHTHAETRARTRTPRAHVRRPCCVPSVAPSCLCAALVLLVVITTTASAVPCFHGVLSRVDPPLLLCVVHRTYVPVLCPLRQVEVLQRFNSMSQQLRDHLKVSAALLS